MVDVLGSKDRKVYGKKGHFGIRKRTKMSVYTVPEYRTGALLGFRESSGHLSQMKLPQTDLNLFLSS